jgi:hypothetical protein
MKEEAGASFLPMLPLLTHDPEPNLSPVLREHPHHHALHVVLVALDLSAGRQPEILGPVRKLDGQKRGAHFAT